MLPTDDRVKLVTQTQWVLLIHALENREAEKFKHLFELMKAFFTIENKSGEMVSMVSLVNPEAVRHFLDSDNNIKYDAGNISDEESIRRFEEYKRLNG